MIKNLEKQAKDRVDFAVKGGHYLIADVGDFEEDPEDALALLAMIKYARKKRVNILFVNGYDAFKKSELDKRQKLVDSCNTLRNEIINVFDYYISNTKVESHD